MYRNLHSSESAAASSNTASHHYPIIFFAICVISPCVVITFKYQGVKEFHMLARIGCCNFMVFSPFKVNVTYYHPVNQWLLGATNGNQGQTVMHHQCSETINHL